MDYVQELRELIGHRPLIIAGATILVFNDKREILLQLRSDTKEWGLPGGAMELGESFEQTARRELFEETGLTTEELVFVAVFSGREFYFKYPNDDEVFNVIVAYETNRATGELAMNDGESLELKFFDFRHLPEELDERTKIILARGGIQKTVN
ncbi:MULTISPECIES: NUDIX hydrolase [unclassified Sporolactobacillus]|uniref:NUDIX hydrolase n=1 Tax=unclassified Sporolactobacillus TaxID=2628533 RepID=UPI0023684ECE|nr:NUDIX hydrolase [Sporolactobacillus sp. CQH2019]MDD9148757.1 NUDIX hydrolase [Sporolactobacillus sp. CQH2019]